jgi:2'-hydroxyisoflavone reductase
MDHKRRKLIKTGIQAGAISPFLGPFFFSCAPKEKSVESKGMDQRKKLNILILGGTSFLGPHQVAYALERGHSISTFTRGKTKPTVHQEMFDQVESLVGDRENDLEVLKNRKWDAVIDNSGRNVEWTKATAELLKDNVGLYLYTSSTGVYYPYLGKDIKEETKLVLEVPEDLPNEEMKMEYGYGVMKANSELAAKNAFGANRTIVVRPTYMVGPADLLDRFIHWPVRLSRGGEVLVAGKKDDPVQFIDVRDVAQFMIRLIEDQDVGTYNAVGPKDFMGMHAFVEEAKKAFDVENEIVMIDDYAFLKEHDVYYIVPWVMPEGNNAGSSLTSNVHSINHGLTYTPLVQTMKDTHDWWYSDALTEERRQKYEGNPKVVLNREAAIIEAWKKRG